MKSYLSLGSNVGDRAGYIQSATQEISKLGEITAKASIYETPPWGYEDQPAFLNTCLAIETDLKPLDLLYKLKQIETRLGRVKRRRWGPREIDIDILLYGDEIINHSELKVPHPNLAERAFVLVPLAEIAPDAVNPISKRSVSQMLAQVDTDGIEKINL